MEQHTLLFVLMLLACTMTATTTAVHCTTKSIFILSGQSNMVGLGGTIPRSYIWDGIIPPECESNPRILRLNNDSEWEVAHEPLHKGIWPTNACGIGPGIPFAKSILKPAGAGETIGLVPCAVSGSKISEWARGSINYNRMLNRAQAAVANGTGGAIRALLWYQGESDTATPDTANAYKANLVQLFNDLRNDLHSPSLPIIQVALAPVPGGIYINVVRAAQLNSGIANVYCVDAFNLTRISDGLHLDSHSQVELGKKLAAVFNNISAAN